VKELDVLGTAMISLTGYDDQLRMFALLANVKCRPTKSGVSFTWRGVWEYDILSGTGSVKLGKDGQLTGKIGIRGGDQSSFRAVRANEPDKPIPEPPRYPRKWGRKW